MSFRLCNMRKTMKYRVLAGVLQIFAISVIFFIRRFCTCYPGFLLYLHKSQSL